VAPARLLLGLRPVTVGEFDEWLERRTGQRRPPISFRERAVVGWSGMRGAVTLAAALAIPLTTDAGTPFPQRDLIHFPTLCVIGATLVVQGFTLPALVKRLGLEVTETSERPPRSRASAPWSPRWRTWANCPTRASGPTRSSSEPAPCTPSERGSSPACAGPAFSSTRPATRWRGGDCDGELLDVERQTLYELRNDGAVAGAVVVAVESELDSEMARLETRGASDAAGPSERLPVEVP
jgi:monovalent cation/hydrogen antiporter